MSVNPNLCCDETEPRSIQSPDQSCDLPRALTSVGPNLCWDETEPRSIHSPDTSMGLDSHNVFPAGFQTAIPLKLWSITNNFSPVKCNGPSQPVFPFYQVASSVRECFLPLFGSRNTNFSPAKQHGWHFSSFFTWPFFPLFKFCHHYSTVLLTHAPEIHFFMVFITASMLLGLPSW